MRFDPRLCDKLNVPSTIKVGRALTLPEKNQWVGYRDHNSFNCQRHNLRIGTPSEIHRNQRKTVAKNTSKFIGVRFYKPAQKFSAQIATGAIPELQVYLGYFDTELEAARAYNAAAFEWFGEDARINDLSEYEEVGS